jgi:hypothetical protein
MPRLLVKDGYPDRRIAARDRGVARGSGPAQARQQQLRPLVLAR